MPGLGEAGLGILVWDKTLMHAYYWLQLLGNLFFRRFFLNGLKDHDETWAQGVSACDLFFQNIGESGHSPNNFSLDIICSATIRRVTNTVAAGPCLVFVVIANHEHQHLEIKLIHSNIL